MPYNKMITGGLSDYIHFQINTCYHKVLPGEGEVSPSHPDVYSYGSPPTLLAGGAAERVAKLKKEHDKTLIIFGSGQLVRSSTRYNPIDEYVLQVHPLVLGKGRRLFDRRSSFTKTSLVATKTTGSGIIIASYKYDKITADLAASFPKTTKNGVGM